METSIFFDTLRANEDQWHAVIHLLHQSSYIADLRPLNVA